MLSNEQVNSFRQDGFVILPGVADAERVAALRALTEQHLQERVQPLELESAVGYPGAPSSTDQPGGDTPRRLLQAWDRHELLRQWATNDEVTSSIKFLLGSSELWLTRNHHNTVMTKHPRYSSDTLWHRDTRYWHYTDNHLINAWTALGPEHSENGGMKVIPGSHLWHVDTEGLDDLQFLKLDYEGNQAQLERSVHVDLQAGDVLLFSPFLFHAADRCKTEDIKCSVVFTYRGESTLPVSNTRSSLRPDIKLT